MKGFELTGTLGILRLAARRGLIDRADTLDKLKRTDFRYRQETIDDLLNEFFGGAYEPAIPLRYTLRAAFRAP